MIKAQFRAARYERGQCRDCPSPRVGTSPVCTPCQQKASILSRNRYRKAHGIPINKPIKRVRLEVADRLKTEWEALMKDKAMFDWLDTAAGINWQLQFTHRVTRATIAAAMKADSVQLTISP